MTKRYSIVSCSPIRLWIDVCNVSSDKLRVFDDVEIILLVFAATTTTSEDYHQKVVCEYPLIVHVLYYSQSILREKGCEQQESTIPMGSLVGYKKHFTEFAVPNKNQRQSRQVKFLCTGRNTILFTNPFRSAIVTFNITRTLPKHSEEVARSTQWTILILAKTLYFEK